MNARLNLMFNSFPIYDRIFSDCMGTIGPASLARVLPAAATAFEAYITHSWHKHLLRYFPDPREFRTMQARTGCLVSGSLPVQLLFAQDYGTDADLYPQPGTEEECGSWLGKQGFRLALEGEPDVSFDSAMAKVKVYGWQYYKSVPATYRGCDEIAAILPFIKNGAKGAVPLQVHLVVSKHSPIATILGFHASMVMNFMTWNRLYTLFPRTTVEECAMVVLRPDERVESEAVYKYILRGFTERHTFPTDVRPQDLRSDATGSELAMTRWVGDRYTWTVSLDTKDVVPPSPGHHVDVTLYGFTLQQMSLSCARPLTPDRDAPTGDTPSGERLTSGHIRVMVDAVQSIPWGETPAHLSVPYTAPHDFSHTLGSLSWISCPSCRRYVFDPVLFMKGLLRATILLKVLNP